MVDQANSKDAPERTPPEFGTLRAVDDLPSDDFVAAVEQRAALKGDVAGRTINWRLRRRLKRLAGGLGGIAVVAAIAGGAYLYREDGGDPFADSVTAVGSAADTVGAWIDEQTADDTGASSNSVVSRADQEVLARNVSESSQETTPDAGTETQAAGATQSDTDAASAGDASTGATDVEIAATQEPGVAGADAVETQAADVVAVEPEAEPVETLAVETPAITAPSEEDVVDGSDNADVASTVDNLTDDELSENGVTAPDAAEIAASETESVETAPETPVSDTTPTETTDADDVIVPTPETPPPSDGGLADADTMDDGAAVAETSPDDLAVPPLPAENIADIDTVLPEETVSNEPVDVAEIAEPVAPVADLPIMSAYSHSGIRVELADYGSAEQAQEGWRELKSELGGVVGDQMPVIEEGSAGAGLIYRVQIGYFDSAFAAANFCTAVMDRKVTCTVIPQ